MKQCLLIWLSLCVSNILFARQDSLITKDLEQVVVTATKSERMLGALPIPVSLIGKKQLTRMGAVRLNDVLMEQTGLVMVYGHGTGIQMQGFSPEYTLILLDGEPIVGRTAGTLDLSRLAVGAIKQIEIVKGPSSSLYGSEALAGVVNIITESATKTGGSLSARYGSFSTLNLSSSLNVNHKNIGAALFANRYSSDGYDLNPKIFGQTVSPFQNYTLQPRFRFDFSEKTQLKILSRLAWEMQQDVLQIGQPDKLELIDSKGNVSDINLTPLLIHQINDKVKLTGRYYFSKYRTRSLRTYSGNGSLFERSYFDQTFARPEVQADFKLNKNSLLLAGLGRVQESVEATRYEEKKRYHTYYGFIQFEHFLTEKLHYNLGGRYDAHSAYRNQFSPKIAALYQFSDNTKLRASYGFGYKAPDFRALFLNFTNAVAGYSVFGSEELAEQIENLNQQGQLQNVLVDVSQFGKISPESSKALNVGGEYVVSGVVRLSANLFRNDVKDLIESFPVATKTNGQFVYSYRNLNAVFTQGAELNAQKEIDLPNGQILELSTGYQYLEAKDKAVLKDLKAGNVYRRNLETLETTRVPLRDYGGLLGRSRHHFNFKVFYSGKNGFNANIRMVYRSRYGIADQNGNALLDTDREYVRGFLTTNIAAAKEWTHWACQIGADNLFNYTDARNQPGLGGRKLFANLEFRF